MLDNLFAYGLWGVSGLNVILTTCPDTSGNPIVTIIQLIVSLISIIISVGYLILKWYNAAKADGKVTTDEIEDLLGQIKEEIDKTNQSEEEKNEEKKNE